MFFSSFFVLVSIFISKIKIETKTKKEKSVQEKIHFLRSFKKMYFFERRNKKLIKKKEKGIDFGMSKTTFRNSSKNYFFNTCFDKTHLKNLISWLIKQSGEKITIDFLEKLKEIGFHEATLAGVSLGLDDLQIPSQKPLVISQAKNEISSYEQQNLFGNLTSVEKSQGMISTWNQTSENLRKSAVQQFKTKNPVNPVYMMAFSGARGNISQVRQLVAMRGLMADPQGGILEFPIQSNFREGLTVTEYLISCYGARKGLVDTALRTATSGYLTRRLVDSAQHVIVTIKDCGTEKGFRLRNKDLEQHLIGRVLAKNLTLSPTYTLNRNQIVSPKMAKLISKKFREIFVRSPLTCQAETTICQLCYGWNLAHASLVNIGEAVGVLAAQSIGEPGTQLTMRTFHTGGVGVFSDQAMKYFLAPNDGIIEYTQGLTGHFVRTPDGKIVYMVKMSTNETQNIIFKIKSIDKKETLFFVKKQELPPGSILWVRQGEQVKKGQVLAQASQIKKSQQKMPESTHQIFSPVAGEIYFESMPIVKQSIPPKTKTKKRKKKKDEAEKEIGPEIKKLQRFGSFWIFSSQNQHQFQSAKSFLRPGDLISSKTSLLQYNFYTPRRTIFQPILNKPCVGTTACFLPVETVNFHKNAYSLVANSSSQKFPKYRNFGKNILFFTKKTESFLQGQKEQHVFLWLPQNSLVAHSGYSFSFLLYSKRKNSSVEKFSRFSRKTRKSTHPNLSSESVFYFTKNIEKWKFSDMKKESCSQNNLFLQTKKLFSFPKNTFNFFLIFNQEKKKKSFVEYNPLVSNFSHQLFLKNQKTTKVQTKFFSYKQKNYLICSPHSTTYLKKALDRVKNPLLTHSDFSSVFFQKNKGWVYIPSFNNDEKKFFKQESNVKTKKRDQKKFVFSQKENFRKSVILEQGKIYDKLLFSNCKIAIKFISTRKIGLIKSTKANSSSDTAWYFRESFFSTDSFLNFESLKTQDISLKSSSEKNSPRIPKKFFQCFLYYKVEKNEKFFKKKRATKRRTLLSEKKSLFSHIMKSSKKTNQSQLKNVSVIYCLNEFCLPNKQDITVDWYAMLSWNQKNLETRYLTKSPLVLKQTSTLYKKYQNLRKNFTVILSQPKGWFSSKNLSKILINLNSNEQKSCFSEQDKFVRNVPPVLYKNVNQRHLLLTSLKKYTIPISGLNFFFYNSLLGPENNLSSFDFSVFLFENTWVTPDRKLTTSFISPGKEGEFRRLYSKKETSVFIFLTKQDLVTLNFSKIFIPTKFHENAFFSEKKDYSTNEITTKQLQVGAPLRTFTEIVAGNVSSSGGLILNKKFHQITLRVGTPFLVSTRGLVHIFQNDLIEENDLLVTLKSRRLQTEDIVQGIPKIEQLFEARRTQGGTLLRNSVHIRLKKYFISWLKSKKETKISLTRALPEGVALCFHKIQFFLVQSILQAYSSQGVKISQKHIEVIVRQMTSRVRILNGGDTGLLVGELLQFTKIQKLNEQLSERWKRPAIYEPLILGITKSVLQSESFLLAASFQEVSRVLVRSALSKKTDFLRGLHENVILGQLVPIGTGIISVNVKSLKK